MHEKVPIIVILGIDIDDKPHASRFDDSDASLVLRAAEMMGFHVIRVPPENSEIHEIAASLPLGKIFASGKGFVPLVRRTAFDKLALLVAGGITIEQRAVADATPAYPLADMYTTDAIDAADTLWAKVEVGTTVLVAADPEDYGRSWWEAVVVSVNGDDLELRWVEGSETEPFHLARREVALRHPADI